MFGPGAEDPTKAIDFDGTDKEVFRTSLVAEWAVSDTITLTSLTGYTDASISTSQDIGKWFEDKCGPNQAALLIPNSNPLVQPGDANYDAAYANGTGSTMKDYLDANGLGDDWRAYAPCTDMTPDGVNDLGGLFAQNSFRDTTQFSQELRMSWDISDAWNFTTGLQYWKEELEFMDLNSTMITSGAECYYNTFGGIDAQNNDDGAYSGPRGSVGSFGSPDANSSSTDPVKDQCGQTALIAAYWAPEAYAARQADPGYMKRTVDHYSWYGSVDWNITDKLTFRVEGRYTKEDNTVTGPVMTPCLNGEKYLSQLADPEGLLTGCSNGSDTASGQPDPLETANGGQATGPSAVLLCGQTGRCDRVAVSLDNYNVFGWQPGQTFLNDNAGVVGSWWAFGFSPAPKNLVTLERTDRYWAPKATVEYFVNNDVMTYFSWSRGIKPGGFSLLTSGAFGMDANLDDDFSEIEFEPEVLDVWEIGAKTTLFDGRVRLNGAAFFQDFKDKQVTVQKVVGNTTGTEVVNISGSEVKGIELDATWQATDNWLLQGGYTYLDSEYTDYTIITQSASDITRIELGNPGNGCIDIAEVPGSTATSKQFGCVASFNGNELERAPKHAFLLNATYTNNLFDTGMEWYTEANYRYQDSRWMEAFNIVEFPAYSLTDLRLGLLADAWDVQFYVNNVFDSDTVISGGSNPGIANAQFNFGFTARPGAPGIVAGPRSPARFMRTCLIRGLRAYAPPSVSVNSRSSSSLSCV